jgi:hypothetical protein
MCPLCLTSLAVTVTATTGAGAAAVAVATRVAKILVRRPADAPGAPLPSDRAREVRGDR